MRAAHGMVVHDDHPQPIPDGLCFAFRARAAAGPTAPPGGLCFAAARYGAQRQAGTPPRVTFTDSWST